MNKLLQKYKSQKDQMTEREKNELILQYSYLVKMIVHRMIARLPAHVEYDDLYSVGSLGLFDAIEKFDPTKNIKFETYAKFRIKGAIVDELRSKDWVPRSVRDKFKEIERVYRDLENRPDIEEVTDEVVAQTLGISIDAYHELLVNCQPASIISYEDLGLSGDHGQNDIVEFLEDPKSPNPFDEAKYRQVKAIIAQAIERLPEKQQLVMALYYFEELTLKEIGAVMGVTEARASQLHSAALFKLKTRLASLRDEAP